MNNNVKVSLFLAFIFLMGCVMAFYVESRKGNKETDNNNNNNSGQKEIAPTPKTISYYTGSYEYEITTSGTDELSIQVKEVVQCITEPCNPISKEKYVIKKGETNDDLFDLINSLVKDNTKSVTDSDLTDEQIISMKKMIKGNGDNKAPNINYKVLDSVEYGGDKNKGYSIRHQDDKYIVTISMGEKNTGGYSINVTNVIVSGDDVTIYVSENTPPNDAMVTMALTYPAVQVELDKVPNTLVVINDETNEKYKSSSSAVKPSLEYNIMAPFDGIKYFSKTFGNRGFYAEEEDTVDNQETDVPALVTISLGIKDTTGYSVKVDHIDISGNNTTIYVKEEYNESKVENKESLPLVRVEFVRMPNNIVVKDIDSGEEFLRQKK